MTYQEEHFEQKIDFSIWKKLLYFAKPYRKIMTMLAISMTFVAGVDIMMPLLTRYIIDHIITPKTYSGINTFALIYFIVIAIFSSIYDIW